MKIVSKIKYLLWNHGLISMLLLFNILPFITVYITTPVLLDYRGEVTKAVVYQSLALFAVLGGYQLNNMRAAKLQYPRAVSVKKSYFYFLAFVSLIGAYVSYANIMMFTNTAELQSMIVSGENVSDLRSEAGSGGLSGVFKMFAAAPLFSFLATSSLLMFFKYDNKTKNILLLTLVFTLFCTFIKVMFVFDRLSILAIVIVFVYNFFFNHSFPRVLKIAGIVLLILLVSFMTLLRMSDINLGEFLGMYFNMGIYNLEISIEKQEHFNYFFTETFLHPFSFVFKYFNIPFHSYTAEHWVWNPAQSFWGFYFVDMNWLGVLFLPFLGWFIKKFEISKNCRKFWALMYFVFAYATFSMVTVPMFRGPEFLLMIVLAYVTSLFFVKIHRI